MPLNRQEVFNKVYAGLKAQGFLRAIDHKGYCEYRGLNGTKCAVGHLISDKAAEELRGLAVNSILRRWYYNGDGDERPNPNRDILLRELGTEDISDEEGAFLSHLQVAHDGGVTPDTMIALLGEFAQRNSLTVPETP